MFGRKKSPKREMTYENRKRRYGKTTSKYPKTYTMKQWKRFSPDIQQELTNRYTVTISDYKTKGQQVKSISGKIYQGISKFGVDPSPSRVKKKYAGTNYLDQSIRIKSANDFGIMGKKKSKGYFNDLAKF